MSDWYDTFDSAFFITITTIIFGVVSLSIRSCLRSKCKKLDCCGILIERDTEAEEHIDERAMELKRNDSTVNI
jgi:hypothetical protein